MPEALNVPEHTARQEDSSSPFRRLPITPFTDPFQGALFVFIEPRSSGVPVMIARGVLGAKEWFSTPCGRLPPPDPRQLERALAKSQRIHSRN